MADSVFGAVQSSGSDCVERRMAVERMAEFCDHLRAVGPDILSGMAKRLFAAGDGFAESRPSVCGDFAKALSVDRRELV